MKTICSSHRSPGRPLSNQEKYEYRQLRHHRLVIAARFLIFAFFLAIWEFSAYMGYIDAFFFSSPSRVALCFFDMIKDGTFFTNTGITLLETVVSFFLVLLIGMLSATLLWYSAKCSEILEPYLVVLNSLPKSALAPLFIVWLGTGINTIIVAGISVAIFGSIINLYTGFRQVDEEKIKLIYTLGGNKRNAFLKVVLPGSIPTILSNMKVNIGLALVGVIIGEFLAARRGLGYLIIYGSQVFRLNMKMTERNIPSAFIVLIHPHLLRNQKPAIFPCRSAYYILFYPLSLIPGFFYTPGKNLFPSLLPALSP